MGTRRIVEEEATGITIKVGNVSYLTYHQLVEHKGKWAVLYGVNGGCPPRETVEFRRESPAQNERRARNEWSHRNETAEQKDARQRQSEQEYLNKFGG
jgi:hypothetical protein